MLMVAITPSIVEMLIPALKKGGYTTISLPTSEGETYCGYDNLTTFSVEAFAIKSLSQGLQRDVAFVLVKPKNMRSFRHLVTFSLGGKKIHLIGNKTSRYEAKIEDLVQVCKELEE